MRAWQLSWSRATTGRVTNELLPNVKSTVKWSGIRSIDISYARLLLGSTNLNDDMYRVGFSESPNCDCGKDRETPDHFLLSCEHFKEARVKLMSCVAEVWFGKKCHGNLNVTKQLLLGPKFSEKLNINEDHEVKIAFS